MDRMSDSGSDDGGSNPFEDTQFRKPSLFIQAVFHFIIILTGSSCIRAYKWFGSGLVITGVS